MIISVWEVQKVKEIMAEIRAELDAQKIPYGKVEFGIMIETPAAVIIADELAKEVDFFQYRNQRSDTVYTGNRQTECKA